MNYYDNKILKQSTNKIQYVKTKENPKQGSFNSNLNFPILVQHKATGILAHWFYLLTVENELLRMFPRFVLKSHTVTFLGVVLAVLFYFSTQDQSSLGDQERIVVNTRRGVFFCFFCVIAYGFLFFRNTYFVRPHPTFWRVVKATGLCYLICLVFCLFQQKEDLLFILNKFVDPRLGIPIKEKVLYWQNRPTPRTADST